MARKLVCDECGDDLGSYGIMLIKTFFSNGNRSPTHTRIEIHDECLESVVLRGPKEYFELAPKTPLEFQGEYKHDR
jgi:hypothetical protein